MKSIIKKSNANNKNKPKKRVTFKDHMRRHNKKQTKKIQWGGEIAEDDVKNLEEKYGRQKIWNEMYFPANENQNEEEKRIKLFELDEYLTNGIQDVDNAIKDNSDTAFSNRLETLKTGLDSLFSTVHPMLELTGPPVPQMQMQDLQNPVPQMQDLQNPVTGLQQPFPQIQDLEQQNLQNPVTGLQQQVPQMQDLEQQDLQQQDLQNPDLDTNVNQQDPNSFTETILENANPVYETDAYYANNDNNNDNSITDNKSDVVGDNQIDDQSSNSISDPLVSFEDFDQVIKAIEPQIENIICLLLLVLGKKNDENKDEEISKVIQEINSKISADYWCKETDNMYKKMNDAMVILSNSSTSNLDILLSKIMSQTINYINFYDSIVTKYNEKEKNVENEMQQKTIAELQEKIKKLKQLEQILIDLTKKVPGIEIDNSSSEQSDKLSTFETFIDTLLLAFTTSQILIGGRKKTTKKANRRIYKRRQTKRKRKGKGSK